MIRYDCKQGSDEWHRLRAGIPTASEFHKIITPKTRKLSKQAESYMNWLLAEWIFGMPLDNPETQWMQRGHDLEPQAVKSYEFERDCEVETVGFITTDDGMIGASPDRMVGNDGLLEIKCPSPQIHVGYMLTRTVDEDYMTQLQGQLYVCERKWVDIQSYCPGLPTVIIRVERDVAYIAALANALREFVVKLWDGRVELERQYGEFRRNTPREEQVDPRFAIGDEDVEAALRNVHQ